MSEWVKPVGLAVFVLLFAVGVAIAARRQRKDREQEEEALRAAIDVGVKLGTVDKYGQPLCVVCGEVATHPTPHTGKMWLDRIPVVRTINDLTSMPRHYSVVDDLEGGARLCRSDYKSAVQHLKRVHSNMRSEHAEFNSRQEQKINMLEQGGLERLVLQERREIKEHLGLNTPMRSLLHSTPEVNAAPATHILTASTAAPIDEEVL